MPITRASEKKSFNSVSSIICPNIMFNAMTIKKAVTTCLKTIHVVQDYIDTLHLSNRLCGWIITKLPVLKEWRNANQGMINPISLMSRMVKVFHQTRIPQPHHQFLKISPPPYNYWAKTIINFGQNDNQLPDDRTNKKLLMERGY